MSETATADVRQYHKAFPLSDITFDPKDNYRWGSEEAMAADIAAMDTEVDGQPASSFDTLKRSIAASGVNEPIGLRTVNGKTRIIYGFTRYLASSQLKLKTIPAFHYEDLTEERAAILQMSENSHNLKRGVSWVASTRMFSRLVDANVDRYMSVPVKDRPTDSRGYKLSPRRIAEMNICEMLGLSVTTMREWARLLKNSHPAVVRLAEEGRVSAHTAKEFLSPSDEQYPPEFVARVVAEVVKVGRGRAVQATLVRRVVESLRRGDRGEAKKSEKAGNTEPRYAAEINAITGRMSAGVVKDVATNFASNYVEKYRLGGPDEDAKGWQNALMSTAYFTIIGLALASGEVPVPESAQWENGGDVTQAGKVGKQYAKACFLRAVIRYQVKRRFKVTDYSAWLAENTARYRTRRFEVQRAIDAAMEDENESTSFRAVFLRAWDYLIDSATIPKSV